MATWYVRPEGTETPIALASEVDVMTGLRDGIWKPTDDVKGPNDAIWTSIESHPSFEDAAEELEPLPPETDDTHLDMNPLIDVCLVLLIFFILTITVASLERAIEVPETSDEGAARQQKLDYKDVKDQVFRVTAKMDLENVVLIIEKEPVKLDDLEDKMKRIIEKSGRRMMLLDIDGNVPWGVQTAILDAAKGNGVNRILYHPRPRR
jgi:biopolymer transport protein ExbD